ncbi:MAG: hypothetical protein IKH77_07455 [Clostridia bacterium]|nr:hypothetical protein [Clostridia bacterium]
MSCAECGKAPLTQVETGLTRKLINRGAVSCYCLACLAKRFRVSQEQLLEMAEAFRASGCTLFR